MHEPTIPPVTPTAGLHRRPVPEVCVRAVVAFEELPVRVAEHAVRSGPDAGVVR
jgi:hypothetical protein